MKVFGSGRPPGFRTDVKGFMFRLLAHQNRTIAIASDLCVDGAKSPEISQKERVWGSEIAARNRKSLATFHRTLKSQCSIAFSCLRNRAISGVRDGHRNRKSQKSLRFRCAKFRLLFRSWTSLLRSRRPATELRCLLFCPAFRRNLQGHLYPPFFNYYIINSEQLL